MNSFYVSIELQNAFSYILYVHFVVSTLLNIVALFCLLRETPSNQITLRSFLLQIQIMITLNDLNLDILFDPIPLFPACAGYCTGILCRLGLPMRFCLAVATLVLVNTGVSIIACFVHRHQTIVGDESIFKFKERTVNIVRIGFLFVIVASVLGWVIFHTEDQERVDRLFEEYPVNLTWIKTRGSYIFMERTFEIYIIFALFLVILFIAGCGVFLLFLHLFYTLGRESAKRSKVAMKKITRSAFILIVQLGVPATFIVGPGGILVLGVLLQFPPFEICLTCFFLVPLHPLAHNVILLSITPAYRSFIKTFIQKVFKIKTPMPKTSNTVTVIRPSVIRANLNASSGNSINA